MLVVYLSATSVLLIRAGRADAAYVVMHLVVLAMIAATTFAPRVPAWVRAWAPLLVLFFLYSEMPVLIRAAGHDRVFDATVVRWEAMVFGWGPAWVWAGRWPWPLLSEALHLAYLSYYAIIFAVPLALAAAGRHDELHQSVFTLMLAFLICFVVYIAFPVAGPRYVGPMPVVPDGPVRRAVLWLLETGSSKGTAFPSSHVAVAVTQSLLAVRYFGRRGLVVAALTVGLQLGAIYGGFHYAIDALVGALLGVVVAAVGVRLHHRLSPAQANANAPT